MLPTFCLGKGNNVKVIKDAFKKRWWWRRYDQERQISKLLPEHKEKINFIWTQIKVDAYYDLNAS
jgi:hypothetical protein